MSSTTLKVWDEIQGSKITIIVEVLEREGTPSFKPIVAKAREHMQDLSSFVDGYLNGS